MNTSPSDSQCACTTCQSMCKQSPCFPTPTEVQRLLASPFAYRLALTVYGDVQTGELHPAITGIFDQHEGCIFQTETGQCELHAPGLKPTEGRLAHHTIPNGRDIRLSVCRTWHSAEGISVIEQFPSDDHDYKRALILILRRHIAQQP